VTPIVSFIIPVRNSAEMLERCLRSIAANDYPRECLEIVVADNGSTDRSREVAEAAGAIVLTLPGLRVGELRNRAAHAARGEVLAFIDADHEIRPEWARVAVDALAEPGVRAAGALCHSPVPGTWVQRQYDALRGHPRGRGDVEWLGSGNLGVRRDAFEMLGGFDTRLTPARTSTCARVFAPPGIASCRTTACTTRISATRARCASCSSASCGAAATTRASRCAARSRSGRSSACSFRWSICCSSPPARSA